MRNRIALILLLALLPASVAHAAIDTAAKRYSAATVGHPGRVLPAPDGTISTADRYQLGGAYIFNTSGGGGSSGSSIINYLLYIINRHHRR